MEFDEYYKNKEVVDSYDTLRNKGLKGKITRMLEYTFVDILTGERRKQDILEIGVGTGFIAKMIIKKGDYYGIDISKEMLKKAKDALPDARLYVGSILDLKLNKQFDKVVTIRVISHFNKEDALSSLKNVFLVLKKDGEVVFNLENRSFLRRFLRKITKWGSTYTYQYSKKDIESLTNEARFKISEILYLDHSFILPLHLLNKLFLNKLENFVFNIEMKLRHFRMFSNNSFIKCKKY